MIDLMFGTLFTAIIVGPFMLAAVMIYVTVRQLTRRIR